MSKAQIIYRSSEPQDKNFIMSSWFKSYKKSPWAGVIPNHKYFDLMKELYDGLVARGMKVVVATVPTHDAYLGFIAWEVSAEGIPVLHYIFVKGPLRGKFSLAQKLLAQAGIKKGTPFYHTHQTYSFRTAVSGGWYLPKIARRKELNPIHRKHEEQSRNREHESQGNQVRNSSKAPSGRSQHVEQSHGSSPGGEAPT